MYEVGRIVRSVRVSINMRVVVLDCNFFFEFGIAFNSAFKIIPHMGGCGYPEVDAGSP
jgi:hypothetical protein